MNYDANWSIIYQYVEDKIKDEVAKLGLIKILIPFIEPKSTNLLPTVWLVSELYSSGSHSFK